MRLHTLSAALLLLLAFRAPAQAPFAGADSVRDFSGVQGQNGWHYGYWDVTNDQSGSYETSDFQPLPVWTGSMWRMAPSWPPWSYIDASSCHPDDGTPGPELVVIRRWVSPVRGRLRVSGVIAKIPSPFSNGVIARILVRGADYESAILPGSHATGHRYEFLANFNAGDELDLLVYAWGDDGADHTRVECSISPALPVVASSTAGFSAIQGSGGWKYGYYDGSQPAPFTPADFSMMTHYTSGQWAVGIPAYWTSLTASGGHPNGHVTSSGRVAAEHWIVRRWESTVEGSVNLRGMLAKANVVGGNGVTGHIFVDGLRVWSHYISGSDGQGIDFSVPVILTRQSVLDFAIDPVSSNDLSDSATFTVEIELRDRFRAGTPGCSGPSLLLSSEVPRVGATSYSLLGRRGPSSGFGLALLATSPDPAGTPLPEIEVVVHVAVPSIIAMVPSATTPWSEATWPLPIPSDSSLAGLQLFAQALWIWPASPPACVPLPTPLGLSSSNGLSIFVQAP